MTRTRSLAVLAVLLLVVVFLPRDRQGGRLRRRRAERAHGMRGQEWRPLVRIRSGRGAEQTHVYVRDAVDDLKLMIVTLDGNHATVIRAKMSPEALSRFARDPKLLGVSLKREE